MSARILAALFGACTVLTGAMVTGVAMHRHEAIPTWAGVMLVIIGAVIIDEADDS